MAMVEKRRIDLGPEPPVEDNERTPLRTRRGAVTLGSSGRVRAEFVKSRRVVRFIGEDGSVAEFDLLTFLDLLGIEATDLAPPRQYVLFGGTSDRPSGGSGDIAGTFADEASARSAFQRLRMSSDHRWAQLVALDVRGRVRALSWFGDKFRQGAPTGAQGNSTAMRARRTLRRLSVVRESSGTRPFTTAEARGAVRRREG